MIAELLKRAFIGSGMGGWMALVALAIIKTQPVEMSLSEFGLHMLGCLLLSAYFGAASILFDMDDWSPLKQTVIHFIATVVVFFSIAVMAGWIMLRLWPIVISLGMFVVIYSLIWLGVRAYLKRLEASMNEKIRD